MGSSSASHARGLASNTACSRFDAVSSGPNRRNVSGFARITSRSISPSTRVASLVVVPGDGTSTA